MYGSKLEAAVLPAGGPEEQCIHVDFFTGMIITAIYE